MELNYRMFGKGNPLIIIHGLYGSSDNWLSLGKKLAAHFQVWIPDMRNHGNSPHALSHDYEGMKGDLKEFADRHDIRHATFIGHSMGGKAAAYFAWHYPELLHKLVIVDINPLPLSEKTISEKPLQQHRAIIAAMQSVNLDAIHSRQDADKSLAKSISSKTIRQFLLKNLTRNEQKGFQWKINLDTLQNDLEKVMGGIPVNLQGEESRLETPALFLYGGLSHYLNEEDIPGIRQVFPNSTFHKFPDTGHWIHAEIPEAFLERVREFIWE